MINSRRILQRHFFAITDMATGEAQPLPLLSFLRHASSDYDHWACAVDYLADSMFLMVQNFADQNWVDAVTLRTTPDGVTVLNALIDSLDSPDCADFVLRVMLSFLGGCDAERRLLLGLTAVAFSVRDSVGWPLV